MVAYLRRHHLALVALFVALGGSAYAAGKIGSDEIARNAVRGKHVAKAQLRSSDLRDDAVKGADVLESSLGIVPEADRVDGAHVCSTDGVLSMAEGDPDRTICQLGALSVTGICRPAGPDTQALLLIETAQDSAFAGAELNTTPDLSANTAQSPAIAVLNDLPGAGPSTTEPTHPFYAGAPDGAQLSGVGGAWADADLNTCRFVVGALG